MTTTDDNKAIVRRFVDEVFVRGSKAAVDELVADDFVAHTWPSASGNAKADLKGAIDRVGKGLSDVEFTVDDLLAEGDRVAARLTSSATQTGEFMNLAPSGRHYSIAEIHWFRLRDGRIVEHWHQMDQMGLMQQLGAMPGGGSGASSDGSAARDPEAAGARS
jgi:steroid delta-isomerase-like uncharacterized protein